jgi:predicted HTH domain antitoxin
MKRYCYYCDKEVEYKVIEKGIELKIKGVKVTCQGKIAYCNECGREIDVPVLDDENIKNNSEYRKRLAATLYAEGKISLGKAAEISGLSYVAFLDVLAEMGITLNYDEEDLEEDLATVKEFLGNKSGF